MEVTPGNSLVLRCEVSTPAMASHLLVDSWTTKDGRQISVAASHQNHFRGKKSCEIDGFSIVTQNIFHFFVKCWLPRAFFIATSY